MPLQDPKSVSNYIKVNKIWINSDEKVDGNAYNYRVVLKEQIQYVTGMELTSYNLPNTIAPTFSSVTDKLDFFISDGVDTTVLTLEFPIDRYVYEANFDTVGTGYTDTLQTLLQDATDADPWFGVDGPYHLYWTVNSRADEKTEVVLDTDGEVGFTFGFNFTSGPNTDQAANYAMGFEKQDYVDDGNLTLVSPNKTIMEPYRYIDINIDEVKEFQPFARVFITTNPFYGITSNEINVARTRMISSEPIRRLQHLTIKITLEGGVVPPVDDSLPHDLGITIFSVANEGEVPAWVNQTFVL